MLPQVEMQNNPSRNIGEDFTGVEALKDTVALGAQGAANALE